MTDDVSEETEAAATRVAQALLSVIGNLHGVDRLPALDPEEGEIVLGDRDESLQLLADTPLLSGPAKLELLAQVSRGGVQDEPVQRLAKSLVRPELDEDERTRHSVDLIARVQESEPGNEPLGRSADNLRESTYLLDHLAEDVQSFAIVFAPPDCHSKLVKVDGTPALSIKTTAYSTKPIGYFRNLVDPRNWPLCPLQHTFFRSMEPVPPLAPPLPRLQQPDAGWKAELCEVVDFTLGLRLLECQTELKFVYFADASRVGCTYDLHRSIDHRITVDQGYLLLENLTIPDLRRTTTLKQVHFRAGVFPPDWVCLVWSTAMMIISWACTRTP